MNPFTILVSAIISGSNEFLRLLNNDISEGRLGVVIWLLGTGTLASSSNTVETTPDVPPSVDIGLVSFSAIYSMIWVIFVNETPPD